jgi:MFS family permease
MAETEQIAQAEPPAGGLMRAGDSLLDYLQQRDYAIGVDHYLKVGRLLASLAARGEFPASTSGLASLVGPVVCESAAEQDRFEHDFREWMRTRGEVEDAAAAKEPVLEEVLRDVERGWLRWVVLALGVAGIALVIAVISLSTRNPERAAAVPGAGGGAGGGTFFAALLVVGIPAGILMVGILGAVLWRRARLQAFLTQEAATKHGDPAALTVAAEADAPIFDLRLLAQAAKGFGAYRRLRSEDLDVPASVAATSREAGRFVPVYAVRPAVPEYLILIDRRSSMDLFARFAEGIVQALEAHHIALERFYFDAAPGQCYAARGYRPVTAEQLVERYPSHHLMVFSDGTGFVNPANHQYGPWMGPFAQWEEKTLFTPNASSNWGARERLLAAAGWALSAAGQSSIAAVAHGIETAKEDGKFVPGILQQINASERRWLGRTPPAAEEIASLMIDLRISLGAEGFGWLCGCAAYPAVDWVVTMYLGANLKGEHGRPLLSEPAFLALSRLPWFRYGRLPEWLRLALLGALPEEKRERVRQALQTLLASEAAGTLNGYRLELKREHWRALNWLTRELMRKSALENADEDPLADAVFLRFLSGAHPSSVPLARRIVQRITGQPDRWAAVSSNVRAATGKAADVLGGSFSQTAEEKASAPGETARTGTAANWKTIVAVAALGIASYWLRVGFSIVIPAIQRDLALSTSAVSTVFSAFALAYLLFQPIAGFATARFGSRAMVLAGLLVSALATAWAALARDATGLIFSRILLGAGLSVVIPARCAIFAEVPERRRALANGCFESSNTLGNLLTPVMASLIALTGGWRISLSSGGIVAAILGVAWYWIGRSTRERSAGGRGPWLSNRIALGCSMAYFGYSFCLQSGLIWGPQLLRQAGFTTANASSLLAALYGVLGISAIISGWFSDWLGRGERERAFHVRRWFVIGGLALAASIGGIGSAGGLGGRYLFAMAAGAGLGMVSSNLWALLQSAAPPGAAGKWGGIQGFWGGVAGLFAPVVMGAIASNSSSSVMPTAAAVALLSALTAALLIRANRLSPRWMGGASGG